MSNGVIGPKGGRVDLYGREVAEPAADQTAAKTDAGAAEKPLDLSLPKGWKSGSVVPPSAPADKSWKLPPSSASPEQFAKVATDQAFKAGVTGFTGPLAEEAIRGQTPPDRSVAYFGSNFNNLITKLSFNLRDTLHVGAGGGSAIQAYAAARRAGLSPMQSAAVGTVASFSNGAAIEASQMMKGDPRTGQGIHPGSLSDVAVTGGLGAAAGLAVVAAAETLDVPVLKDVLRNADRVMVAPNVIKTGEGRLKVDGARVFINIPF